MTGGQHQMAAGNLRSIGQHQAIELKRLLSTDVAELKACHVTVEAHLTPQGFDPSPQAADDRGELERADVGAVQEDAVKSKKQLIKECETKIAKYDEQQKNVRNNREFNAISKEMEFQELEIQLAEKRIKEHKFQLEQKTEQCDEVKEKLQSRVDHLNHKKNELNTILEETKTEEEALIKVSKDYGKKLDDRLLKAYRRIRDNSRNGLAVVAVDRGASGGSFFTIPPQRQMEIAARRKIITDEHSGRILVDPELAAEEKERMEGLFKELVG